VPTHFTTLRPSFGIWHFSSYRIRVGCPVMHVGTEVHKHLTQLVVLAILYNAPILTVDELGKPASRSVAGTVLGGGLFPPTIRKLQAQLRVLMHARDGGSTWTKRRFFRTAATEMRLSRENGRFAGISWTSSDSRCTQGQQVPSQSKLTQTFYCGPRAHRLCSHWNRTAQMGRKHSMRPKSSRGSCGKRVRRRQCPVPQTEGRLTHS
jgi:hypothetical protein